MAAGCAQVDETDQEGGQNEPQCKLEVNTALKAGELVHRASKHGRDDGRERVDRDVLCGDARGGVSGVEQQVSGVACQGNGRIVVGVRQVCPHVGDRRVQEAVVEPAGGLPP